MTTNYDPIAEQYKRAKQQPWHAYIDAYTIKPLITQETIGGQQSFRITSCSEGP
jgi:hypothetical protein